MQGMIEQSVNPQASIAGLKGLGGKGGNTAVEAGLFAKLMAAFQAQLKASGADASVLTSVSTSKVTNAKVATPLLESSGVEESDWLKMEKVLASMLQGKGLQGKDAGEEGRGLALSSMEKLLASQQVKGAQAGTLEAGSLESADMGELKALMLAAMEGANQHRQPDDSSEESSALAGLIASQSVDSRFDSSKPAVERMFTTSKDSGGEGRERTLLADKGRAASEASSSSGLVGQKSRNEQLLGAVNRTGSQGAEKGDALLEENPLNGKSATPGTATKPVSGEHHSVQNSKILSDEPTVRNSTSKLEGADLARVEKQGDISVKTAPKQSQAAMSDDDLLLRQQDSARSVGVEGAIQKEGVKKVSQRSDTVRVEQVEKVEPQVASPVHGKVKASTPNGQIQAVQSQYAGVERAVIQGGESSGGSLQQERGGQTPEMLLADTAKADVKSGRGSDFALQMSQKSHHLYKPAEVMMEVARSAKDGALKIELQLEPAHLGRVHVSLQSDAAKQIQVHFTVDQAASRQALEAQMPQLRLALAQQGLDLGQFSMNMSSQGEHGGAENSSDVPFSQFVSSDSGHETEHRSTARIGVNNAADGHISILA